jgi:hypothetical protein
VAQPLAGKPQPAPLRADTQQDLRGGQADKLRVGELGWPARATPTAHQLIDGDVQCDDEGVEIGVHEASPEVDVASATPILGALARLVTARHPHPSSEAII